MTYDNSIDIIEEYSYLESEKNCQGTAQICESVNCQGNHEMSVFVEQGGIHVQRNVQESEEEEEEEEEEIKDYFFGSYFNDGLTTDPSLLEKLEDIPAEEEEAEKSEIDLIVIVEFGDEHVENGHHQKWVIT